MYLDFESHKTMSRLFVIKNIVGFAGRCNDIIYMRPKSQTKRFLIFFGGDCQDFCETMREHNDSKHYIEWSLENTSQILSENFPQNHIVVIHPSRMEILSNAAFSCYDNFVPGDTHGIPQFCPSFDALQHLLHLIKSLFKTLAQLKLQEDYTGLALNDMHFKLMGFSKGCVVLNQILFEFNHFQINPQADIDLNDFIKSIKSMWWLDGGHGGSKDTWITNQSILESFAKLGIKVFICVTPYQIEDEHRPWIRIEEASFYRILKNLNVPVEHKLYFLGKPRNLKTHFQILKVVKDSE